VQQNKTRQTVSNTNLKEEVQSPKFVRLVATSTRKERRRKIRPACTKSSVGEALAVRFGSPLLLERAKDKVTQIRSSISIPMINKNISMGRDGHGNKAVLTLCLRLLDRQLSHFKLGSGYVKKTNAL
jgi:hypothetical protein